MTNMKKTIKYFLIFAFVIFFIGSPVASANGSRTETEVDTLNPSQIRETSAILNAFISPSNDYGLFVGNDTEVWFEWGTDQDDLGNNTVSKNVGQFPTNYQKGLTGLEDGEKYYYRVAASNLDGITRGGIRSFVAGEPNSGQIVTNNDDNDDDDDNNNGNDGDEVATLSATSIDEDSARLRGEVTNGNNVEVWFVLDDNDSTPSCNDNDIDYSVSGNYDDGEDFSRTVSGLDSDTKYYFRACTDDDSGSIRSFTTDDDNGNSNSSSNNSNDELTAITTNASGVLSSSAILNGLAVLDDGRSTTAWFEYGTTVSLGNRTPSQSLGSSGSRVVSQQLLGLQSSKAYFFRLVVQNSRDIDYGDVKSLYTLGSVSTTGSSSGGNGNTTNVTNVYGSTSSTYLGIDIESNLETVSVDDVVTYTVSYKNISGKELKDIVITVDIPREMKFIQTTLGDYSKSTGFVVATFDKLGVGENGEFFVITSVTKDAKNERILVTSAEGLHNHPSIENVQVTTVDYSIIEVDQKGSSLVAGTIFSGTFFPATFIGWLLLALIILILILIARRLAKDKKEKEEKKELKIS